MSTHVLPRDAASSWSHAERVTLLFGFAATTFAVAATRVAEDTTAVRFWDNAHWTLSYASAFALAWLSRRRARGALCRARTWFTRALFALFFGQVLWDVQVAIGWNPFPGPSDLAFVAVGPLLGLGVVCLTRDQRRSRRIAVGLDGVGLGLAMLALTLAAYLPRRGDFDAPTLAVLVAYPTALLTVTALIAVVALELMVPPKPGLFLLFAAVLGQGLLWMEWNLATLNGELDDATLLNYAFSYGALLLGAGVASFDPGEVEVVGALRRGYGIGSRLVPLALVVTAAVAMLLSSELFPQVRLAVTLCMVGVVIAAALRQSVMLEVSERLLAAEARSRELEERLSHSQRLESLGTLAGGIAHDFNNLLTAMLGHVELLHGQRSLPPEARESVDGLRAGATRARDVVRRILTFSRRDPAVVESVDAVELVEEVVALLRAALPARHALELVSEGRPRFTGSVAQIHQVLMNLGTNASQAIGDRPGRIRFTVRRVADGVEDEGLAPGSYIELCVEDDGAGMDAPTQARMFDPFFTTKPRGEGTGLGLSVVHGIVLEHGGALRVRSATGAGTTFRVLIPAASPAPAVSEAPAAAVPSTAEDPRPAPVSASRPQPSGEVLVVDDEPMIGFTLVRLLIHLGHRALPLTSPAEALSLLERDPARFCMVVTDMSMPSMTGADFARAIHAIRPDLRVVLSSGTDFVMTGTPFDDVLPKPYTLVALQDMLSRNLGVPVRAPAVVAAPPASE